MSHTVEIPLELLEEVAQLEFPSTTQEALDRLMDKNNEGQLSEEERKELQALVDLNEKVAQLKGRAGLALRNAT
jgi:hypothetical protein